MSTYSNSFNNKSDFLRVPAESYGPYRGFMEVVFGSSNYVTLVRYDSIRKTPTGKKNVVLYGIFEPTKIWNLAYNGQFMAPRL